MKKAVLSFPNTKSAEKTLESLKPEAEEPIKRTKIDISFAPPQIKIESEDTSAMRAALNSYLRWIDISKKITEGYSKEE